jgi:hypothetical protein
MIRLSWPVVLLAGRPGATFFTLEGSDHNDPLPAEFYTALRRFLEES